MAAHQLSGVTVVADAGMVSEANRNALEAAGLTYIIGEKIPAVPYQVRRWRETHPDEAIPDGHVFTAPWPASPNDQAQGRRDKVDLLPVQARPGPAHPARHRPAGRQGRTAVAGDVPVKRNRFLKLAGGQRSVNRELEAKARALAGLKAYLTNLPDPSPEFVLGAYHRLFQIEKSFRMSKHDLQARPIYHHKRESIEAHLSIVFAALAVTRHVEAATGWSIKRFVRTARRYRTVHIKAGAHILAAQDPLPDDLRDVLAQITSPDKRGRSRCGVPTGCSSRTEGERL